MKTYKQLNPICWETILEHMDTNFRIKLNKYPKLAEVNKRVPLHIKRLELFSRGFIVDGTNYSVFDVVYGKVCFAINYKTVEITEQKEEMEKYNAFLIGKLLAGKVNVWQCVLYAGPEGVLAKVRTNIQDSKIDSSRMQTIPKISCPLRGSCISALFATVQNSG